jgi:hypothetical protein
VEATMCVLNRVAITRKLKQYNFEEIKVLKQRDKIAAPKDLKQSAVGHSQIAETFYI